MHRPDTDMPQLLDEYPRLFPNEPRTSVRAGATPDNAAPTEADVIHALAFNLPPTESPAS